MRLKVIALALVTLLPLCLAGCSPRKLAVGETGVIDAKDAIFGAVDRKAFQDFAKASSIDDKVEEVKLMTHGQIFTLSPGTKVKVLESYEYGGYLGYRVQVLDGPREGEEVFVNFVYVKAAA